MSFQVELLLASEPIVVPVTRGMGEVARTSMNVFLAQIIAVQTQPARTPLEDSLVPAKTASKQAVTIVSTLMNVRTTTETVLPIPLAKIKPELTTVPAMTDTLQKRIHVLMSTNAKITTEAAVKTRPAKMKPEVTHVPAMPDSMTKAENALKKKNQQQEIAQADAGRRMAINVSLTLTKNAQPSLVITTR